MNDTIHEVLTTLLEAFVLVVIVVFLFLGSLRATIIPAVAVPVSLIGTFAFLLLIGYSANTVSLLALVLAIGIVVDDAIVVVENVERVMEEDPETGAARGHQEGDAADHRADHRHHAWCCSRCSCRSRSSPASRAQLFRQFAVTISGGHADLGDQRADAVAGALRCVPAPGPDARADHRHVLRGIDLVRDGYAARRCGG